MKWFCLAEDGNETRPMHLRTCERLDEETGD